MPPKQTKIMICVCIRFWKHTVINCVWKRPTPVSPRKCVNFFFFFFFFWYDDSNFLWNVWKWHVQIFQYFFAKTCSIFRTHARVWFQHARVWLIHAKCGFYTQSLILTRMSVYTRYTSVICTRSLQFLHEECDYNNHKCDFDKHECDRDTHECFFNTLKITN
jgi:hypothetical protein